MSASAWSLTPELFGNMASVLTAGAALAALIVGWRQLAHYRRQVAMEKNASNREHHRNMALASIEFLDPVVRELQKIYRKILDAERKYAVTENDERKREKFALAVARGRLQLVTTLEMLSLAVNTDAVNIGYLNDCMGTSFEDIYSKQCAAFIRRQRRGNPKAYREIETVLDNLHRFRRGIYCVTDRSLEDLRRDMVDEDVIGQLEDLKDKPRKRDQMASELRKKDIRREKYFIMRRTYHQGFDLEEFDPDKHLDGLADLFAEINKNTQGRYPFIRGSGSDGFRAWLDEHSNVQHLVAGGEPRGKEQVIGVQRYVAVDKSDGNGQIIGHIAWEHPPFASSAKPWEQLIEHFGTRKLATIEELFVKPDKRNHGLGRILLRHALHHLEEEVYAPGDMDDQARILLVVVEHKKMARANHLYTRDGGCRVEDIPPISLANGKSLDVGVYEFGGQIGSVLSV